MVNYSKRRAIDSLGRFLNKMGIDLVGFEEVRPSTDPDSYVITAFMFHPNSSLDDLKKYGFNDMERLWDPVVPRLYQRGILEKTENGYSVSSKGIEYLQSIVRDNEARKN